MSLTGFVKMADVKAKLKPLHPVLLPKIDTALSVEPRSKRYMVVGSAFDYLLRFELHRRAPHAGVRCWTAESVPDGIWRSDNKGGGFIHLSRDEKGIITYAARPVGDMHTLQQLAKEVAGRVRTVLEKAKSAYSAYLKNTSPARIEQAELAAHAIRLAKLDDIVRSPRFDSTFEDAAAEDVEDLLALLALVPFSELLHDKTLLLNPDFPEASHFVGGADADLIAGDMLVDFKTTKSRRVEANYLDELLGYYLLARRQHQADPTFPAINSLALYFCRQGYLLPWDATLWAENPQFVETEQWFFNRAKEVFRVSPRRKHGQA